MPTRRHVIAGLVCLSASASALPAPAAEQTAKDFLDRIYKSYVGKDAAGMPVDRPAVMQMFTPAVRKLIAADAAEAKKRDEVPNLDGDPFVDAQEWDIRSFTVEVNEPSPGKAKAIVRFKNFDETIAISLDLVKQSGTWQIDEIVSPSGSLRALLQQR